MQHINYYFKLNFDFVLGVLINLSYDEKRIVIIKYLSKPMGGHKIYKREEKRVGEEIKAKSIKRFLMTLSQ
jgi:hypothetical protein